MQFFKTALALLLISSALAAAGANPTRHNHPLEMPQVAIIADEDVETAALHIAD